MRFLYHLYWYRPYRWTLRSIIDIAIGSFTPEDRYFLWITALPLWAYNRDHIWDRACACLCYTHKTPFTQSVTRVGSSLLDALTVLSTITFPVIVFTSSPTCFAGTISVAINLIAMKDLFFFSVLIGHQSATIVLWSCDWIAQWLKNSTSSRKYVS